MTITKKNYLILKRAALHLQAPTLEVIQAIEQTEQAAADHNARMVTYITDKRKNNKNYCR